LIGFQSMGDPPRLDFGQFGRGPGRRLLALGSAQWSFVGPVANFGNGRESGWIGSDLPRGTQPENCANPPGSRPADKLCDRPIAEVKRDQKTRGRFLGGTVPFGYRLDDRGELVPHEEQQEAIREAVAMKAAGASLRAIADALQAKGHTISHVAVSRVLRDHAA
jgi:hypothetical protein